MGNTTIPNFSVVSSGNLGCNTTVTLMASSSTSAGITYTWSGPGSFTSAVQNPTINVPGDYTVSAFDISTGCVGQLTISVTSSTTLPIITATIIPATCTGTSTNNDGTIILGPNGVKYDLVVGGTYTGSATYVTAIPIPTNGVITNTLPNPTILTPYVVRVFGSNGCFKDTLLLLHPVNCFNNIFGITKAASTPSLINNKYEVTFTVTAVNASTNNVTDVMLNENLLTAFPGPSSYSIISPPVITSQGSNLVINAAFDGSTSISLTSPLTSTLLPNKRDTIVFTVRIDPNGFFGAFYNSVIGSGLDVNSLIVSDSSNDGFLWDPDMDGFPTNNNTPTPINLAPNTRLGIAKSGVASVKLSDDTYDFTYVVTVKNFGNDTLKLVQVKDSLARTIPLPAHFTIKSAPVATGTLLTVNTAFNGSSDISLLTGTNSLAPGQVDSIRFTINVTPDTVTVFRNTAMGYAVNQFSTATRDSSQTGNNPDVNNNGNPNEVSDSDPTVIVIPQTDLFIPEVITPNDDGKNDFFVIKGGRKLKLTVFNRWGNKVYEKGEYDNTWNGYPNTSGLILGHNKLPQGTYYYIIEFSDGENKPITGYVVLQY
jgi:gliding motility-associated-like protein